LAAECLATMPFETDKAVAFIDEYSKYLEFQSDLEILAKPPPGYLSNAVDLRSGLQAIRTAAARGDYSNQFQFDSDISDLINSANDGHLNFQLCSMSIFQFAAHDLLVVSISPDGVATPQLYTIEDARSYASGATNISPIAFINGFGAASVLESQARRQWLQDPDAQYNMAVSNLNINGQGEVGSNAFALDSAWRGVDSYKFQFANQTSKDYKVVAAMSTKFNFNYTSGKDLYNAVCGQTAPASPAPSTTPSPSQSAAAVRRSAASTTPAPSSYPSPIMREDHNLIVGYYPTEHGLEDVAVLGVPTFQPTTEAEIYNFAVLAQYFVGNATKDGKTKIIVDLQSNGGGLVNSGMALYSVFFPNETLYSATRMRSHDALDFIGTIFNAIAGNANGTRNPVMDTSGLLIDSIVMPDQESTYNSWSGFYGPYLRGGIPSTAIAAESKFADEANPATDPINTDGLGGELDFKTPPFAPENIVILTDGRCTSTCSLFTDRMISKGVRTVAMGGRPHPGAMQAVGGVKGSQALELSDIDKAAQLARSALNQSIAAGAPILSNVSQARFQEVMPIPLKNFPLPLSTGGLNYRNTYTKNDTDIPTQFIYEPASCHLFYTAQTIDDPSVTWSLAANATWGSGTCVGGINSDTGSLGSQTNNEAGSTDSSSNTDSVSPGSHEALGLLLAL
ncbi:hypothetical protein BGW36DRAFT_273811, partial [Talaromyces proteolyticus]